MAKKRTLIPFYGKANRRIEDEAHLAARMGLQKKADDLYVQERKLRDKKADKHESGVGRRVKSRVPSAMRGVR